MATKKKAAKKRAANGNGSARLRGLLIPGDPPIIVGGGGSTLVWIRSNVFVAELTPAQVTQMLADHPNIPHSTTPANYRVFRCNFNAVGATVKSDDSVRSVRHNDMDTDRHHTVFHQ